MIEWIDRGGRKLSAEMVEGSPGTRSTGLDRACVVRDIGGQLSFPHAAVALYRQLERISDQNRELKTALDAGELE